MVLWPVFARNRRRHGTRSLYVHLAHARVQANTITSVVHERFFVHDIDNVAHNVAKIDAMCAFYFAAAHNKAFNNLAHKHLKQLQQQSEKLYVSRMEENLCTSLLQAHDRAKLLQKTQEAAQRLQVALSRVWKGDHHLPPWGPPLVPGDRQVEQIEEWSFPIPWTVVAGKNPKSHIRVATATASDPKIRSIEVQPEDAVKFGILQPTAVFWGAKQTDEAPATAACEAIDRAAAAVATAASRSRAKAGTGRGRATPRGAAQAGGARAASGSSGAARGSPSQAVPASRTAARAVGTPATATPGASARVSPGSTAEALESKLRITTSPASAAQKSPLPKANQYTPPTEIKSSETSHATPSLPPTLAAVGRGRGGDSAASTTQRAPASTARTSDKTKLTARGYVPPPTEERSKSPAQAKSPRASTPRQRQR